MKIKKNGEVIKLSESDLKKIVKRVLNEELTFNVNDPEFGIDGERMKRDSGTWSYFDPKMNKYNTRQGVYGDHNDEQYSEEWEDYEFDDFTDLKRSDIPNDDWRDLRTRKGFDSMKGDDGKVRIRKNPYKYRRNSGIADIRINEQEGQTYTLLDTQWENNVPERVKVLTNQGFNDIEDKDAVEIMKCGGSVNRLPNLNAFPNLFLVNLLGCQPLIDIHVDSLIDSGIARVLFNYVDTPIMNSKVNELEIRAEEKGMDVTANKVNFHDVPDGMLDGEALPGGAPLDF